MTTYGFKYNGEGSTIYYGIVDGISYERLIVGKYYSKDKDGCYLYVGTSEKEYSELIFNYAGGPYDDSICSIDTEFCHHFVDGCGGKENDYWFRDIDGKVEIGYWYSIHFTNEYTKPPMVVNDCLRYVGLEPYSFNPHNIIYIDSDSYNNCDCEDKPEPPTTENSECVVSTCKGTEQHINVSNDILNLLDLSLSELNGNHTFKWNNKCYYIVKVVGEENPELPIMDIEHLNGIYPGCTECNNDGVKHKDNTEYYEKVNCDFADAVYNKAMSDRYGVEFCCEKDLQRLTIKKKLLDAGQLQDDIDLCEF